MASPFPFLIINIKIDADILFLYLDKKAAGCLWAFFHSYEMHVDFNERGLYNISIYIHILTGFPTKTFEQKFRLISSSVLNKIYQSFTFKFSSPIIK